MNINPNTLFASAFLERLYHAGLRHIVISPGSRNTPLVFAAVRFTKFHLYSVLDERSAGFYALGIAKGRQEPVMLISTSGTAAAEYYPALIEASMTGVPLLVCTADRPERLTGTGANQTIFQEGMYGRHIQESLCFEVQGTSLDEMNKFLMITGRVLRTLYIEPAAPVHLNFRFDTPLEPSQKPAAFFGRETEHLTHEPLPTVTGEAPAPLNPNKIPDLKKGLFDFRKFDRGIILVGPYPPEREFEKFVIALSKATGYPILADGVSNLRSRHKNVLSGFSLIFRSGEIGSIRPDVIIQCGQWSTSRSVENFIREHESKRIVIPFKGKVVDPLGTAIGYCSELHSVVSHALEKKTANSLYFNTLHNLSKIYTSVVSEHFLPKSGNKTHGIREHLIGNIVTGSIEKFTNLVVGNSMVVRDWDDFCTDIPQTSRVFSNRGASGIDGLIATALGVATGSRKRTVLLVGDNAFFYDLNSLLLAGKNEFPLTIVVINNGGGRIFEHLPVAAEKNFPTEFYLTPQTVQIEDVAKTFRLPYFKAEHEGALALAVKKGVKLKSTCIIEAVVDAPSSIADRKHLTEKIAARITAALV